MIIAEAQKRGKPLRREATENNTGMMVTMALNYSTRTEIVDCFNAWRARRRAMAGSIT